MFFNRVKTLDIRPISFASKFFATGKHTPTCPTIKKNCESVLSRCPGSKSGGGVSKPPTITRAIYCDKVRLVFIPEEWFLFFHSKTGVSGPYIFGIVLANYLASKEIFVMEHEYYTGLSWILILYIFVKKLGPGIAAHLDKEVDDVTESYEKTRKDEMTAYESIIKNCKDAQWRAEGQKLLLDAKKENVAMQLEAIFRERSMHAYKTVKGRMDYHVKRYRSEARIQQKWMIEWILEEVRKSITPDFEKQALDKAIQDLVSLASRSN